MRSRKGLEATWGRAKFMTHPFEKTLTGVWQMWAKGADQKLTPGEIKSRLWGPNVDGSRPWAESKGGRRGSAIVTLSLPREKAREYSSTASGGVETFP